MTLNLFEVGNMFIYSRATKKNQRTMIQCDHGGQETKKTSKKAPGNGIFSDFDHLQPYIYIYIYINIYHIYIYIYILLLTTTLYNTQKIFQLRSKSSISRSDLSRRYWKDFEIDFLLLGAKIFRDFFSTFCLGIMIYI